MSIGVEFEGDKYGAVRQGGSPRAGGEGGGEAKLVRWLMAKGIVTTEKGGQALLIVIVVFNIAATIIVLKYFM